MTRAFHFAYFIATSGTLLWMAGRTFAAYL